MNGSKLAQLKYIHLHLPWLVLHCLASEGRNVLFQAFVITCLGFEFIIGYTYILARVLYRILYISNIVITISITEC